MLKYLLLIMVLTFTLQFSTYSVEEPREMQQSLFVIKKEGHDVIYSDILPPELQHLKSPFLQNLLREGYEKLSEEIFSYLQRSLTYLIKEEKNNEEAIQQRLLTVQNRGFLELHQLYIDACEPSQASKEALKELQITSTKQSAYYPQHQILAKYLLNAVYKHKRQQKLKKWSGFFKQLTRPFAETMKMDNLAAPLNHAKEFFLPSSPSNLERTPLLEDKKSQ